MIIHMIDKRFKKNRQLLSLEFEKPITLYLLENSFGVFREREREINEYIISA